MVRCDASILNRRVLPLPNRKIPLSIGTYVMVTDLDGSTHGVMLSASTLARVIFRHYLCVTMSRRERLWIELELDMESPHLALQQNSNAKARNPSIKWRASATHHCNTQSNCDVHRHIHQCQT